jgi:hypothetical protein
MTSYATGKVSMEFASLHRQSPVCLPVPSYYPLSERFLIRSFSCFTVVLWQVLSKGEHTQLRQEPSTTSTPGLGGSELDLLY